MRKVFLTFLLVLSLALVMTACGGGGGETEGGGEEAAVGDAANGEQLFKQQTIGSANAPGCITCHSLESGVTLVGPAQHDVGLRSEERAEALGITQEEYLRQSIVEPNAYIVEGFAEGLMYQNYGEELPEPVIDDLVAYLMTLRGE